MTVRALAVSRGSGIGWKPIGRLTLRFDDRYMRRKALLTDGGERILVDLPEAVILDHGDRLMLEDGRAVEVVAAEEELLEVTGDLPRFAWHIGNRHTPCEVQAGRLLIRYDHVLEDMLRKLGAEVRPVTEPFAPERGAYGHGRTHGHSHSRDPHEDPNAHLHHGHEHRHD